MTFDRREHRAVRLRQEPAVPERLHRQSVQKANSVVLMELGRSLAAELFRQHFGFDEDDGQAARRPTGRPGRSGATALSEPLAIHAAWAMAPIGRDYA
jgi:hypothetical protein